MKIIDELGYVMDRESTINVGDVLIVTHDHTGHGIPIGRTVAVLSRCQYILKVFAIDYGVKFVEMDDVVPLLNCPQDYEDVCQERDYKRFWLNFKLASYFMVSVALAIFGIVFAFDQSGVFTNYMVAFVVLSASLGVAMLGRKAKREEELKILKETT